MGFWLLINELFRCFAGQDHSITPCCVQTLLRLCASVSGNLSPKICFYFKILMCISKCSGQVGLGVTLRSLESYQRRLWSQHLFSCRWPPKCNSSVFISMDVGFHLFFRVSFTFVELIVLLRDRLGQTLLIQRCCRQ